MDKEHIKRHEDKSKHKNDKEIRQDRFRDGDRGKDDGHGRHEQGLVVNEDYKKPKTK